LTKEGETIPLCQYPLDLETATYNSVFLVWPATVVHRINSCSPLWDVSAEQMLSEQFEIIVILEGKRRRYFQMTPRVLFTISTVLLPYHLRFLS